MVEASCGVKEFLCCLVRKWCGGCCFVPWRVMISEFKKDKMVEFFYLIRTVYLNFPYHLALFRSLYQSWTKENGNGGVFGSVHLTLGFLVGIVGFIGCRVFLC